MRCDPGGGATGRHRRLILEDRMDDIKRGLPADAIIDAIAI